VQYAYVNMDFICFETKQFNHTGVD